jgi:hypothetical protein
MTPQLAILCTRCLRLSKEHTRLELEYRAGLEALVATPRSDPSYAALWADLVRISERIGEAERLERVHQHSHHGC